MRTSLHLAKLTEAQQYEKRQYHLKKIKSVEIKLHQWIVWNFPYHALVKHYQV